MATSTTPRPTRPKRDTLRDLFDLTADLHDPTFDSTTRENHLLESLARLFRARVSMVLELDGLPRPYDSRIKRIAHHGWTPEEATFFAQVMDELGLDDPLSRRVAARLDGKPLTIARRDLMTDDDWYRTTYASELRKQNDVDDVMGTVHYFPEADTTIALNVHRTWGDRPFTEDEVQLLDAFGGSVARLYATGMLGDGGRSSRSLPPRLREVLQHLLEGRTEKQIAEAIGISRHTVHDYVKALYKRCGVNSRAELLARWLGNNGVKRPK